MTIYLFTLKERFTWLDGVRGVRDPKAVFTAVLVDGLGVCVYHLPDQAITVPDLRCRLICLQTTKCRIEADNLPRALERFFSEWEGAVKSPVLVEGLSRWRAWWLRFLDRHGWLIMKSPALSVDPDEPVLELPDCSRLHHNRRGEYLCGIPQGNSEDAQGEFGMCVLEGYEAPTSCPISSFLGRVYELKRKGDLSIEEVAGYNLVRAANV